MVSHEKLEKGMFKQMELQQVFLPAEVSEFETPPSPTQLAKQVGLGFPMIIRKMDLPCFDKWNAAYLREKLGEDLVVSIAETPLGNADSPLNTNAGSVFVKPHTAELPFGEFMDSLQGSSSFDSEKPVRYLQNQDGCMATAYKVLMEDLVDNFEWADEVLGVPELINLWVGDTRTTSRLHCDSFENLYLQVRGVKKFYLIPPTEVYCLDEQFLTSATYEPDGKGGYNVVNDEGMPKTLFPTVNPADERTHNSIYSKHCRPFVVELHEGEVLYIPSLWYHQVQIVETPEDDANISVNYWYPANCAMPQYMKHDYLRYTSLMLRGYEDENYESD
ncbi:JmjC domain-containing protein 7 [Yarrowia sp. B02]|nr:JmjC domain-containing protein 7 [Yarrowia sp. B02]